MRLEFTLGPADLTEAFDAPQRRDRARMNLAGYAVLLALAVPIAAGWMGDEPRATLDAAAAAPPRDLWVTLAPSMVGFTLVAGGGLVSRWKARRARPAANATRGSPRGRLGTADLLLVASFGWMVLPNVPRLAIPWHPTLRRQLWAAVAPWFAYGVYACGIALTRARHTAAVVAAGSPSLRRPNTVDVTGDGIVCVDAHVEHRLRWPHLVAYRETANLLVLQTEDGVPLILPKRALPDPADVAALRGLIQTHVATGTFLPEPVAFPVLPVTDTVSI